MKKWLSGSAGGLQRRPLKSGGRWREADARLGQHIADQHSHVGDSLSRIVLVCWVNPSEIGLQFFEALQHQSHHG